MARFTIVGGFGDLVEDEEDLHVGEALPPLEAHLTEALVGGGPATA